MSHSIYLSGLLLVAGLLVSCAPSLQVSALVSGPEETVQSYIYSESEEEFIAQMRLRLLTMKQEMNLLSAQLEGTDARLKEDAGRKLAALRLELVKTNAQLEAATRETELSETRQGVQRSDETLDLSPQELRYDQNERPVKAQ